MNGELGMQNLFCALRPGPLTAALLQFTIQNSQFRIAPALAPFFDRPAAARLRKTVNWQLTAGGSKCSAGPPL
jgi:hypothetical protein